jgi:cystathionine beta-lyase/cystathionine gamma-synthase
MRTARLPAVAPSLGGVETLVTRPSLTSHSGLSPEDRRRLGISDELIRLSVGIEATQDLIEDFQQALEDNAKRTPSHRSQARVPAHK